MQYHTKISHKILINIAMTEPHYSQFRPPPREERQTFIDCPDNRFEFKSTPHAGSDQAAPEVQVIAFFFFPA